MTTSHGNSSPLSWLSVETSTETLSDGQIPEMAGLSSACWTKRTLQSLGDKRGVTVDYVQDRLNVGDTLAEIAVKLIAMPELPMTTERVAWRIGQAYNVAYDMAELFYNSALPGECGYDEAVATRLEAEKTAIQGALALTDCAMGAVNLPLNPFELRIVTHYRATA